MRTTTVLCCRCGSPIVDGGSIVDFRAGSIRHAIGESADYCESCSQAWLDFHRQARAELSFGLPVDLSPQPVSRS